MKKKHPAPAEGPSNGKQLSSGTAMESLFKIQARGSTVAREAIGGLTTFLAMVYVAAVNPAILAEVGVPFRAALIATCLSTALMTIVMGIAANRPIALAPGMGVNAIVAYTICVGMGVDWRVAMSVVFVEGLAFLAPLIGMVSGSATRGALTFLVMFAVG